jgi:hypothetical protein
MYGYLRYCIDIAIPYDKDGKLPPAFNGLRVAIENHIKTLKSYGEKINEGEPNEENTISARKHFCRHDMGLPCIDVVEIEY